MIGARCCALVRRSPPRSLQAQVTFDRILQRRTRAAELAQSIPGTLFNQRYSPLTQITPANVKNLELQWVWQAHSLEKFEATRARRRRRALHRAGARTTSSRSTP